jgi:ATP-dependent Clp protease ATP-binding subunit ClpC
VNGYNFTDRVRKVLRLAREQALRVNHEYVGTEHLLLGLLCEGSAVGAAVLADMNIDVDELKRSVEGSLEHKRPADIGPDLPYTSRAKKVLELAMSEARALGHSFVGTEHLLLGLLHPESTPAVTALGAAGATLDGARAVARRLRPPAGAAHTSLTFQPSARAAFLLALVALLFALAALLITLRAGSP